MNLKSKLLPYLNECILILFEKVGDTVIGTHFVDLSTISNDKDKGERQGRIENFEEEGGVGGGGTLPCEGLNE